MDTPLQVIHGMRVEMSEAQVNQNPEVSTGNGEDEIDLLALLGILLDQKWVVIASTALFAALAISYAILATPVYQASALLQVEEKVASLPGLEDLSEAFGSESSTQAELEILKSRSVVGTAVANLNLTTVAEPLFFPIIGDFMHRRFKASVDSPFASAPLGLGRFAWGGESIKVTRFNAGDALRGENFSLTVNSESSFTLEQGDFGISLTGEVGKLLTSDGIELFVSDLSANSGTQFEVSDNSWLKTVQNVGAALSVSEVGRQSGIIRINYQSFDADNAEATVNEIAKIYVDQNIRRLSAEAENSLNFMREQIPFVQRDLERAETAFNKFASENQSIDVTVENEAILNQLVELDTRIQEVELQQVELNRRFTANHPNVIAAEQQYRQLLSERARFNNKIESLPDTQQELFSLRRDVEVASEIYQLLLYKAQEMEVARASTVGNVRVIDPAIVDRDEPVSPKKALIVVIGTLLGGLLGVAIVMVKRIIYRGVESADQIETIGLSVFASIPFSDEQKRWDDVFNDGKRAHKARSGLKILAREEPTDLAVEMLRNLRTSLYFNLAEAENKAVMITGPSPGVGKSFISVNLATTCALAGQKVLLIDADMRRGYLHRYISKSNNNGLSEYLSGQKSIGDVITESHIDNLDVITRGQTPPNPSELLHHQRLQELISSCGQSYDLILFDTPPVLAVTDAKIVGQSAGNTLLVCRFDKTSQREIQHAQAQLQRDGAKVTGAVLNGVEKRLSNYYGYGGYYGYGYGYTYKTRES